MHDKFLNSDVSNWDVRPVCGEWMSCLGLQNCLTFCGVKSMHSSLRRAIVINIGLCEWYVSSVPDVYGYNLDLPVCVLRIAYRVSLGRGVGGWVGGI